jgi:uncharacterized protein
LTTLTARAMNRLLLWAMLLFCIAARGATYTAETVPDPRLANGSHVANPDGVLDDASVREIDRLLVSLEARTGTQAAVVAVDAIEPPDEVAFAQDVWVRWGIGRAANDDGLLILVAKAQRAVRLHTGYGLEGALPDVLCGRIIQQQMVPLLREGQYGPAVLAAVRSVEAVLLDPTAAQSLSLAAPVQPATGLEPSLRNGLGVLTVFQVFVLMVFLSKLFRGHFSGDVEMEGRGWPRALRWRPGQWLLAYSIAPTALGAGSLLFSLGSPWTVLAVVVYVYYLGMTAWEAVLQGRAIRHLQQKRRYDLVDRLLHARLGFWLRRALLFPVPFLVFWWAQRKLPVRLRNAPRACVRCGAPMRKLDQAEEGASLTAAQRTEERVRSTEHDVWQCTACAVTLHIAYAGPREEAHERCPKCKALAYALEHDHVLVAATTEAAGRGERVHACQHCGHRVTLTYRIPKIQPTASSNDSGSSSGGSSSSSSSGGGGGSSWGGGSSGGGGASGRW